MAALRFLLQKTIQNRGKLLDLRQRAILSAVSGIKSNISAPDLKAGLSRFEPTTDLRPLMFTLNRISQRHLAYMSTQASLCSCHARLTSWRMHFPARSLASQPQLPRSAQPSPTGPHLTSETWPSALTIMDRISRWPEAIHIAATTTVNCANALFQEWVSRFAAPAFNT
jgi:hypothetical protein